jgi:hypothetical protein
MSGNAALAAARRRRNPFDQQVQPPARSSSNTNINIMNEPELSLDGVRVNKTANITDLNQLIIEHDKLLFILERKLEKLENVSDFETITQSISTEMKLFKTALTKQQNTIQELTSLVTSLRGSILTQNRTIQELSEQLSQSLEINANSTVELNTSDEK